MRMIGKTLGTLFALGLVGALALLAYMGANRLLNLWTRLDFQVAGAALVFAAAVLAAALIVGAGLRRAARETKAAAVYGGKVEAYSSFIALWDELLDRRKSPDDVLRLAQQMRAVNRSLVVHGATAVVKAHAAMQQGPLGEAPARFADAVIAIRKDLGHVSGDLAAQDWMRLLLPEPEPTPVALGGQPYVSLSSGV
jgi:hypothetical protein